MVFKPFTHLARQNFAKAFTHGYAQSVVAASQSSYASATTFNQLANTPTKYTRTSQLQNVFQNPSSSSGAGAKAGHSTATPGDSGLAAYYAAWQHAQQTGDDSDWRQFQLKRRIGWKPGTEAAEASLDAKKRASKPVSDPKKAAVNVDVSAKVEEAVAREIQYQEEQARAEEKAEQQRAEIESTKEAAQTKAQESDSQQKTRTTDSELVAKSEASSIRIVELENAQRFGEIPAAFEALLKEGLTPTVDAYNSLLTAAIKLHTNSAHAVPRALDVYSDMLRRQVMPNQETYKTLIVMLVSRALETLAAKNTLEQQRLRFGGLEEPGQFLLKSSEVERELLAEDHSLQIALKLFDAATARHPDMVFPLEVYKSLVTACAEDGRVEDMVRIYAHMEAQKVVPHAAIFPAMIRAFAAIGDLKSVVECYNEYRELAISDDKGVFSIVERRDAEVYAAVVGAYLTCGKEEGGLRFLERIRSSFDDVKDDREGRLRAVESVIVSDALVQASIKAGKFDEAVKQATEMLQGDSMRSVMAKICIAAADAGQATVASEAYDRLIPGSADIFRAAVSMLALHVRQGNVEAARPFWDVLTGANQATSDMIQPTTMYAVGLLKSGHVEEGLMEACKMFGRIRSTARYDNLLQAPVHEEIGEALELLGRILIQPSGMIISAPAAVTYLRAMVQNGGLISPFAEHAVASLGPMGISQLNVDDLILALQVQAGMIVHNPSSVYDAAHLVRFAHMVEMAMNLGVTMDPLTMQLVDQAVLRLSDSRPDLVRRWQDAFSPASRSPSVASSPYSNGANSSPVTSVDDSYDPYAHSTDYRGSALIAEELESTKGRPEAHLEEAMTKFKNMRRIGRHPRYITYAKLITAAAKCNRMNLAQEILEMARKDVPLNPQYAAVKYGWASILDAMVAACLTHNDRNGAAKYHRELTEMGSAPSANTFGLYITTLKESTKTYDEATEAVKIFHQAVAEGVEPTSFLYNALIGKLGKARRIDDCLQYFAEMRAKGVRPTSVTYGTIVNALCRVSDERFAEEMFDEMESMPNYKPRPAPYNSMIQYFLTTKRDRSKVLAYYERMRARGIEPTAHTYKLLIDAYASLPPVDFAAAEAVLETMRAAGHQPEAVHYASLIHAKGCVQRDLAGARALFDSVLSPNHPDKVRVQPCLYQALFEAMVANHAVAATDELLPTMAARGVEFTPYIANTLIHGWAAEGNIARARAVYDQLGADKREPSTYEAMTRAYLAVDDRASAAEVVREMLTRGYPAAVATKIVELVGGYPY